jgi:hypothetical protein
MCKVQILVRWHFIFTWQGRKRLAPKRPQSTLGLAHGILLSPAPSSCLVLGPVCLVHVSNFWHQWIIRVWIRQEGTDWEKHLKMRTTLPTKFKKQQWWKSEEGWKASMQFTKETPPHSQEQFPSNIGELILWGYFAPWKFKLWVNGDDYNNTTFSCQMISD